MLSIPGIEDLAAGGACKVELMLELTDPEGTVRRYVNGPRDESRQIGGEAREFEGGDTPLLSLSPPRIDTNLERQEVTVGIASDDALTLETALTSGGVGKVRLEAYMSLGDPVNELVELFTGRLGAMSVDAQNQLTLTFYSGYGQVDAQRSVHATDDEQRAYAQEDDSLIWIPAGGTVIWGREAPEGSPAPSPEPDPAPDPSAGRVAVAAVRNSRSIVQSLSATLTDTDGVEAVEAVTFRQVTVERLNRENGWFYTTYEVATNLPANEVTINATGIQRGRFANPGDLLVVDIRYRDSTGTHTVTAEAPFATAEMQPVPPGPVVPARGRANGRYQSRGFVRTGDRPVDTQYFLVTRLSVVGFVDPAGVRSIDMVRWTVFHLDHRGGAGRTGGVYFEHTGFQVERPPLPTAMTTPEEAPVFTISDNNLGFWRAEGGNPRVEAVVHWTRLDGTKMELDMIPGVLAG